MRVFYHAYKHRACRCKFQVTVFPHSCSNSMQPGPMPSSAKHGLNGIYLSSGCFKAELQRKWLCLQFWRLPVCNHAALLSAPKVTGEIAAAPRQMCFMFSQPVLAKWPGLRNTHTAARGQTLAVKWQTCSQGLRIARSALHWFNAKDSVDQATAWVWDSWIYLLHANFSFSKLAMKFCWRCHVLLWCTLTSQYVH